MTYDGVLYPIRQTKFCDIRGSHNGDNEFSKSCGMLGGVDWYTVNDVLEEHLVSYFRI